MSHINLTFIDLKTKRKKSIAVVSEPKKLFLITEGLWKMVIADEKLEFKTGEAKRINIKPITLGREKIMIPCFNMRHAIGSVFSLGLSGKPKKVEEERVFDQALFMAVEDGIVQENDLLGIVNIFSTVVEASLLANLLVRIRSKIAHSKKATSS